MTDDGVLEEPGAASEPIAIIGMAARVPGADDLDQFWSLSLIHI